MLLAFRSRDVPESLADANRSVLALVRKCNYHGCMKRKAMRTASLTIRDIPRPVLEQLKARAERHRRSMQGEILAILESAAADGVTRRSAAETLAFVRELGVRTAGESARLIRADRDGR
jgi:antitoxin FitA